MISILVISNVYSTSIRIFTKTHQSISNVYSCFCKSFIKQYFGKNATAAIYSISLKQLSQRCNTTKLALVGLHDVVTTTKKEEMIWIDTAYIFDICLITTHWLLVLMSHYCNKWWQWAVFRWISSWILTSHLLRFEFAPVFYYICLR